MSFFIGLLTFVLVVDSLLLILLVLIQLPKKEAGAGVAFGGGATDALFGAGSGNALTKITKYAATVFFSLSLLISVLYAKHNPKDDSGFQKAYKKQAATATPDPVAPAPAVVAPTSSSNSLLTTSPGVSTNPPAVTVTSAVPAQPVTPPK